MRIASLRRAAHSAFTLIELLLALSLSAVVLMLLGMAIDMQWRLFDARRTGVEETLLARAVMRRITDDLRGAILHTPPDLEGLNAIADNPLAQAAGLGGAATGTQTGNSGTASSPANPGTGATGSSSGGSSASSGSTASGETEEEVSSEEQAPQQAIVGIYGSSNWISIDVSRLPRIDEYQAVMSPESGLTPTDIPSDVKTVTYYVAYDEFAAAEDGMPPPNPVEDAGELPVLRGLVRQQLSRAVTAFNESGGAADVSTNAEILAEEVSAIEFAYFDGTQWYSDWSSQDMGGLPVAIALAIQVEMDLSRIARQAAEFYGDDPDTTKKVSIHRMVVHLPAARKIEPVEEPVEGESTDSTEASTEEMP